MTELQNRNIRKPVVESENREIGLVERSGLFTFVKVQVDKIEQFKNFSDLSHLPLVQDER